MGVLGSAGVAGIWGVVGIVGVVGVIGIVGVLWIEGVDKVVGVFGVLVGWEVEVVGHSRSITTISRRFAGVGVVGLVALILGSNTYRGGMGVVWTVEE